MTLNQDDPSYKDDDLGREDNHLHNIGKKESQTRWEVFIIMFIDSKTNDQNMRVLNSFMITLLE